MGGYLMADPVSIVPPFEPYKFGITDYQMGKLIPLLNEMDRNARAYGWEIGHGQPMTQVIDFSPENPFIDPNWRINLTDEEDGDGEPT